MEGLSFEYPVWYLLFCLLLGAGYAGLLYYRDKSFGDQPSYLVWAMGALRFLTVSLLAVLLLEPLLRSVVTTSKKPLVVMGRDASASVSAGMKAEELAAFSEKWSNLKTSLSDQFEVAAYAFGTAIREDIDTSFADQATNMSDFLNYVDDVYGGDRLGALVLATDGTFNQGSNPLYLRGGAAAPVFTVALGDTTFKKDLVLSNVFHNKIAYLGDRVSFQVDIAARNAAGSRSNLRVSRIDAEGKSVQLEENVVQIDNNDFFATREVILEAAEAGVQRFRFSLGNLSGESGTANNSRDVFLDVLDARQQILVLAHAPHPDLTALRRSLEINKNYEVTVAYAKKFKGNLADFDFVVLHQLPSRNNQIAAILQTLRDKNIPRLFILGQQSDINALNNVQQVVSFRADYRSYNEVQATVAENFNLFTVDAALKKDLPAFAPLIAPFGEFRAAEDAQVLLYQKIGKVNTEYPLVAFGTEGETRVGVLCAEGIWKWRLFDYLQHENQDIFRQFIQQSTQYLSVKEDKRKFRVSVPKAIFDENEELSFGAELYNDNYELVNEPDVTLLISDASGKQYHFTFDRISGAYKLVANAFPSGNYSFEARTNFNGNVYTYAGQFSVQPVQLEIYETRADHRLLNLLSSRSGGEVLSPEELDQLPGILEGQSTLKPIIYQTVKTRSVVHIRLLFWLLLLLVSGEWFMRRYFGSY